jgi:hypothetical protein
MVRHRKSYGLPNPTAGGQRPPDLADRARRAAQGLRRSAGAREDEERDPFPEDGGAALRARAHPAQANLSP